VLSPELIVVCAVAVVASDVGADYGATASAQSAYAIQHHWVKRNTPEETWMTPFEDAPFTAFHRRIAVTGAGGFLSDGYSLGIIGIALTLAKGPLGITSWWLGAVGAASLVGLFLGSLLTGGLADRFGRRPVFVWGMLFFTVVAALQFTSASNSQLFVWRLLLGLALGADYVACGAMVAEFSPSRKRGMLLSVLSVAWTVGYISAFVVGYLLRNSGPAAWRIALITSAVPSLITFLLRLRTPESPVWLTRKGHLDKAREIVAKYIGSEIALPVVNTVVKIKDDTLATLFKPPLYRNMIVGCLFFTAQVIPGFALGTFLPLVLQTLHVDDAFTGALIYNIVLLVAVVLGMLACDLIPRRALLIQSFMLIAIFLAILTFWRGAPSLVTVVLFAGLAFVMAFAGILQAVYPPELFPTELRARGISVVIACSRIGAAVSTFFLPVVVELFGIYVALGAFMAISIFAAIICKMWAPETLGRRLV